MLNKEEQVQYYLSNREEFFGDARYFNLLKRLTNSLTPKNKKLMSIDVGACLGQEFDFENKFLLGSDNILLAFEPNPLNLAELEKKKTEYPYLTLIPKAVSNEEKGSIPFYTLKEVPANEVGYGLAGIRGGGQVICHVPLTTLDKELKDSRYDGYEIEFIKIDTEGNDTMVLEGCKENLHRVKYIIFEASDCLDDKRGPGISNPLKTCIDMLDSYGFDVYRVGTKRLLKLNSPYWDNTYEAVKFWSDCFACKKNDPIVAKILDDQNYILL